MAPFIEVKSIGKKYNINHMRGGYVSLRDIITNIFRNPFKFASHNIKKMAGLVKQEEFWALKDVSFSVEKGEVVGIIGPNGAGKSTLLKILTQITPPTEGEIMLRGRVGSLLEVGTGFHPELTGRENIFLNGAILGMKKREIAKRFDEIMTFAGIEKFLDTPVKFYSSGMYVRLAFSVAAHMEPDILIIDEVLAVGDAEFQKKCLGKMDELTKQDGRTILFVSHNMVAIEKLCRKTIWLEKGKIKMIGNTTDVIEKYLGDLSSHESIDLTEVRRKGNGKIAVDSIHFEDLDGNILKTLQSGADIKLCLHFEIKDPSITDFDLTIAIDSLADQTRLGTIGNKFVKEKLTVGKNPVEILIKKLPLNNGEYQLTTFVEKDGHILDWIKRAGTFSVRSGDFYGTGELPEGNEGPVLLDYNFLK